MLKNKNKFAIFVLCLLGYSGAYLCRLNFSAAMPEMTASAFTKAELGVISSLFFFTYGLGQLINGFLGDKIPPRYMLFVGLVVSGITNVVILFLHSYHILSILWAINGFAQSMIWPPVIFILGNYFAKEERSNAAKYFSISVPIGTLLSYGISMLSLELFGWLYAFAISGVILLVIAIIWVVFSGKYIKILKADTDELRKNIKASEETVFEAKKKNNGFFKSLMISGLIIMLIPVAIHGALKDSVTNWVPTFMVEMFSANTSLSLWLTMILPIINITGGFIAARLNEKIKNEVLTSGIFFAVAIIDSVILLLFGKYSIIISIACLAILTNCMFAINLLTISVMPMRFARFNKVSAVSGILNSVAYLGCALVNLIVGFLLESYSWNGVMILWIGLAALGCVVSFAISFMWKKFSVREMKVLI